MENTGHVSQDLSINTIAADDFYDVLIIGGGPHALGAAARLREATPASLYTDLEHSKLAFLKNRRSCHTTTSGTAARLLALDATATNGWNARWNGFFSNLSIDHLRSPLFFHPGPAGVDSLEAFARQVGAEAACASSGGVERYRPTVGQSADGLDQKRRKSRTMLGSQVNERERVSYTRPTRNLFKSFCEIELVQRYNLADVIRKDTVIGLRYAVLHVQGEGRGPGLIVTTSSGRTYGARFVIMSIGGQEQPAIPSCLLPSSQISKHSHHGRGWCHSLLFSQGGSKGFKAAVELSSSGRHPDSVIVVIGGGFYDFPLSWVSRYGNLDKMTFFQEECRHARWDMIKQARNGGSVNPSTLALLKQRVKEDRLRIFTHTSVETATRDETTGSWTIDLKTRAPGAESGTEPTLESIKNISFIVAATGGKLDFAQVPFLQPLLCQLSNPGGSLPATPPIIKGLPVLTDSLQWGKDLPLYVMGAYAALELGPDAANLSGSRSGAERVVSKLNDLLETQWSLDDSIVAQHHPGQTTPSSGLLNAMSSSSQEQRTRARRNKTRMGARERRAGNIGGWFDGLEEVEA
ncbi:hypothetical protein CROQUDRAFT_668281 [Cronartium quercuum f. sp. fusiforme G11]|uniref:FAD/NAD(P)-binding domain-containing protein n=1 Tax=Cronartium quercuum f. sp. fusiforme G11 TaxID=708437 RepID=A0A9P6TGF8_9BASI|nr:hypothetical protein CROQUDRAFT_668281 [Cronartium quercuum f. sp. fusiforme G11]